MNAREQFNVARRGWRSIRTASTTLQCATALRGAILGAADPMIPIPYDICRAALATTDRDRGDWFPGMATPEARLRILRNRFPVWTRRYGVWGAQ